MVTWCYWYSFLSPEMLSALSFWLFFRSLFNFGLFNSHFLLSIKFIQRNEWKIYKRNADIAYSHDAALKCNGNIPIGIFVEFVPSLRMTVPKNENWTTTNQKHVCRTLLSVSCAVCREQATQSYHWTWHFIHEFSISSFNNSSLIWNAIHVMDSSMLRSQNWIVFLFSNIAMAMAVSSSEFSHSF